MILRGILSLFFGLVKLILNIIPALPTIDVEVDFSLLMQGVRFLNQLINLKVVGALLLAYTVVIMVMFIWSIINWVLHKIPGVS